MVDRSKGKDQTQYRPRFSRLEFRCENKKRTPETSTVTKPPQPMEEAKTSTEL
jgi:hypothetical protein